MSHTPGPWNYINHNWHETGVYSTLEGQRVCLMDTEDWDVNEATEDDFGRIQTENARLIAAAPDLLAALQGLLAQVDLACGTSIPSTAFQGDRMVARAVIAKAKGEPA